MAERQGPVTRGFNCANCGAAVELRALQHTRTVVCTSCGAVLDPRDPTLAILQEAAARQRLTPTIPLGTRGTLHGHPYEVVGFQYRTIEVDGDTYGWNEYVLFNPYQGFRYLSEYEGHWNDIRTLQALPALSGSAARLTATFNDTDYRIFQTATAVTRFVLGEFPWRVRVGDTVDVSDFVAPPNLLSRERTPQEATWALGEYLTGARIWETFSLPGSPPSAGGVFANQPSPFAGKPARYWRTFVVLALALAAVLLGRELTARREEVFTKAYTFEPRRAGETAFVTDPFTIGGSGNLEIGVETNVRNNWIYFDLALINVATGTALNVGKEVSYYSGTDSDGPWTEGSPTTRLLVPRVEAAEYYLRVEPEGTGAPVTYTLRLRRDVVSLLPYGVALVALIIAPVVVTLRAAAFEKARWKESDWAPQGGDDDAGEGGDS
jgi:hypothetical protein